MRFKINYFPLFLFLGLFFIVRPCDAQYAIKNSVFSNGGIVCTDSTNYKLNSLAGQGLIGTTGNDTYIAYSGFLYAFESVSSLEDQLSDLPISFQLFQNYPNPFNPATHIKYSLPKASHVKIEVFNVLGQRVFTIVNTDRPAGYHTVYFKPKQIPSGLYFYAIQADGFSQVKKMMLLK